MAVKYELVIFDWEGTLQDGKGMVLSMLKEHVKLLSLPVFDEREARTVFSYDSSRLIDDIYCKTLNAKERVALKMSFQQACLTRDNKPLLFDGALSLLEKLQKEGVLIGIATNASKRSMDSALKKLHLSQIFFSVKTADHYAQKPSPEMIESLLAESGVGQEKAVMVGDSVSDIKSAAAANIDAIGFTIDVEGCLIQNCGAMQLVDSMAELEEILLP